MTTLTRAKANTSWYLSSDKGKVSLGLVDEHKSIAISKLEEANFDLVNLAFTFIDNSDRGLEDGISICGSTEFCECHPDTKELQPIPQEWVDYYGKQFRELMNKFAL